MSKKLQPAAFTSTSSVPGRSTGSGASRTRELAGLHPAVHDDRRASSGSPGRKRGPILAALFAPRGERVRLRLPGSRLARRRSASPARRPAASRRDGRALPLGGGAAGRRRRRRAPARLGAPVGAGADLRPGRRSRARSSRHARARDRPRGHGPDRPRLALRREGPLPGRAHARQVLAPETWQALEERVADGLPLDSFRAMEPWFALLTLQMLALQREGYDVDKGVETQLAASAPENGKPTQGLETPEQQLDIFDSLPLELQERQLGSSSRRAAGGGDLSVLIEPGAGATTRASSRRCSASSTATRRSRPTSSCSTSTATTAWRAASPSAWTPAGAGSWRWAPATWWARAASRACSPSTATA